MIKVFVVCLTLSSLFANVFGSPIELGDYRLACATGVHVIVARGSNESPGQGTLSSVSQTILSCVAGSDAIGVDYPATLTNYDQSEAQGVAALTSMIQSYVASCPNARIVLMGYSQGAHVVGDTLCGSDSNSPLPSRYSANSKFPRSSIDRRTTLTSHIVAAVIQTGDPAHTVGLSFNTGTSTRNGVSFLDMI